MRRVVRYILGVLFIHFLFVNDIFGQVSDGGFPLQFVSTKSVGRQFVELPAPEESAINAVMRRNNDGTFKAFRFALPTEVDFCPDNSGEWFHPGNGYNIWRLTIGSANAKSLIVLFDQFSLSDGARLFLFNESEDYYLGAYTSANNKKSEKFVDSPVKGEEVTIQYEVPEELGEPADFRIFSVNYDFLGILKSSRRPLDKTAGACNIDVNCSIGDSYSEFKNSICRLIVSSRNGSEICSGTLVNNTAEDQKPYILSAAHCYDEWDYAETTVYTFTREFKLNAVELSYERGNIVELANELKIRPELIYRWPSELASCELASCEGASFPGNGNPKLTEEQREIACLQKELADMKMERDI